MKNNFNRNPKNAEHVISEKIIELNDAEYERGYSDGYDIGYEAGFSDGCNESCNGKAYKKGYGDGYLKGIQESKLLQSNHDNHK